MKNQNRLTIEIKNKANQVLSQISGMETVLLNYAQEYSAGDRICFTMTEGDKYLAVKVDDLLEEAIIYAPEGNMNYLIPFGDEERVYPPLSFKGISHNIRARIASEDEIFTYRNLAKNAADLRGAVNFYPHATANIETRGESIFAARNTIDGITENKKHGRFPYQSWGIGERKDAELIVDFGRDVETDKVILYLRADFPHDNYWNLVTLSFSDGSEIKAHLIKTADPQEIKFEKKVIDWVKMNNLIMADDSSPFASLRQIEVYGCDYRK